LVAFYLLLWQEWELCRLGEGTTMSKEWSEAKYEAEKLRQKLFALRDHL